MTDLERLWDDLPAGPAPADAIVRAGRLELEARRRRLVARPLLAVGAAVALLATFVAGTQLAGPPGGPGPASGSDARFAAFQADLDPAASCAELLTSFRDRAMELVTAWGWGAGGPGYSGLLDSVGDRTRMMLTDKAAVTPQRASRTGTNVQEAGVDEPDTVKTDGTRLVRLRGDDLVVYDASGAQMRRLSTTHLPRLDAGEILLEDDTVIAIGADRVSPRDGRTGLRRGSRVLTLSLADPAEPAVTSDVTYSSRILSARQHGTVVRLVLSAGLPDLGFVQPQGRAPDDEAAAAANRRAVADSTIEDWLPTYDAGSGPKRLVDCTHIAIPPDDTGLDTVSVVGIDTSDATRPVAIGLAGATTIAYESAAHLYLASSPVSWGCDVCRPVSDGGSSSGTSHVFDFELDGVDARHIASGEIEGTIADRWSLDEVDGVLRVAVGPSSETGRFSSIVTMGRAGTELTELGRIDGLGPQEDIKSVRWFDDLAIVVTFRQVDPLYTIDLSDPTSPRKVGELKIPGYSEYLHPLTTDQLLGVGYGARGRDAQIALFDVADLAAVTRDSVVTLTGTRAIVTQDPRSFTWLPDRDTVLTVVERRGVVSVAAIGVRGRRLTSTLTHVEYGADAAQVRTLELGDGRIALVTGEDVRFFDVP